MVTATRYWVVSLPLQTSSSFVWARLQESISKHSFDTPLYRFNIPKLRVGTLDLLLSPSDDLSKSNIFMEGVSHQIRRQIEELEKISGIEGGSLTVDGVPTDSYITRFVFQSITMFSQFSAIKRKQSGSLVVRDLSDLVKPDDIVTSEYLVTLLAIVPNYLQKDWLFSYETLATFVLFRSWMHFCAIRVFIESILRYGLPPSSLAAVLAPPKCEEKVRSILKGFCETTLNCLSISVPCGNALTM